MASQSPRRQELLAQTGITFEVETRPVEEIFPSDLAREKISEYLAKLKAEAFTDIHADEIILTADTIVWYQNQALGKPKNAGEARNMLQSLSGKSHEVITSVCLKSNTDYLVFSDITQVFFRKLSDKEIDYYISNYQPFDKAGAYGIQEWIGAVGIEKIIGSYNNVVGLPTEKLICELKNIGIYEL
ncbi:Maf family nucleotide pyrophosphatase [Avrilella dinanensis]|uniref:Maf family nucleotide pyrophosphatase n=1 Tax=Avrilella dinanensis TaxID=2008672 RepID=UPI001FAE91E9|nr:Maf family nucleotide pyrophosphatase [Avrilella dinanensis]